MFGVAFLDPRTLWIMAFTTLFVGAVLCAAELRRRARIARLDATRTSTRSSLSSICIPMIVLMLIAVSLGRPYVGFESRTVKRAGRDIMLAVDVSVSMLARDYLPTRLEGAKRKIYDLIEAFAQRGTGDRVGIVLFAGAAYVFCPLTSDYATVRTFTNALTPHMIPRGGSRVAQALKLSFDALSRSSGASPMVILLTDGEHEPESLDEAEALLSSHDIPVSSLGFGTPAGQPIMLGEGVYQRDERGEIVVSKLNEQALMKIATRSNGRYVRASPGALDPSTIMPRDRITTGQVDSEVRVYHEQGPLLLMGALGILAIALLFRREGAVFLLLFVVPLAADAEDDTLRDGYLAYHRGDYGSAAEIFERFHRTNPDDERVLQALASSYLKRGDTDRAITAFRDLASRSDTPREVYEHHYNLGNSYLAANQPEKAIEAYDRALAARPHDERTTHNRKIAEERLARNPPPPRQSPDPEGTQKDQKKDEKQQSEKDHTSSEKRESKEEQPEGAREEQEGEPTPSPGTGRDGAERRPDNAQRTPSPGTGDLEERGDEQHPGESRDGTGAHDPRALAAQEAREWLDTLPEAPLLLRQPQRSRRHEGGQTW